MNKFVIISITLIFIGILFFGISGFCLLEVQDLRKTFVYYQINEADYLSDKKTALMFSNLEIGAVKFAFLGLVS